MARKKKFPLPARKKTKTLDLEHLPTAERVARGGIVIRENRARVEDPMRIDKLFKNGVIDEMQHLYGMQILTLWTIASRPFLKSQQYEPRHLRRLPDFDAINMSRMTAEDQFYRTMRRLKPRNHELIRRICLQEEAAITAGRTMGLPINGITSYVRDAFDALGEALAEMRAEKRALEKTPDSEELLKPER